MRVWEAGTCTCPYACTRMERELCGHLEADRLCCAAQRLSVARRSVLARGRDGGAAGRAGAAPWRNDFGVRRRQLHWRTRVSGGKRPYLRSMRAPLLQPGCDPGVGAPSRTVVRKTSQKIGPEWSRRTAACRRRRALPHLLPTYSTYLCVNPGRAASWAPTPPHAASEFFSYQVATQCFALL